jgi:hypothetical protein
MAILLIFLAAYCTVSLLAEIIDQLKFFPAKPVIPDKQDKLSGFGIPRTGKFR